MTRAEAEAIVEPLVFKVFQYRAVLYIDAKRLLGDERFERLLKDPIRRLGPSTLTVYPWNVIDFLEHPDLGIDKCHQSNQKNRTTNREQAA